MFEAGDSIGKYTVKRLLGKGGMGAVFLCSDPDLNRDVAVKVINPELQGVENVLKRFDVEARAVAQLDSPYIVKVYEFNRETDSSFLVMEYVPGQCLLELIKDKGAQDLDTVIDCARDVLQALQIAHDGGVIHRDVKPANILHAASGTFKLMDFGLARSLDVESRLTVEGTTMGTIAYLAPEVARGGSATFRSDLYSLGVTLYEMLAGNPPLEDKSPLKLLHRLANEPLPPISAARDNLPPAFTAWLGKVLSHNDTGRYKTAAAALADLEKVAKLGGSNSEESAQLLKEITSTDDLQEENPIDLAAVTVIIRRAQEIESQNRDVLSEESLLEISRDLNISTGAVRKAVVEHEAEIRSKMAMPVSEPADGKASGSGGSILWWFLAGVLPVVLMMALFSSSKSISRSSVPDNQIWSKEAIFAFLKKKGIFESPESINWSHRSSIGRTAVIEFRSDKGDVVTYRSEENRVYGVTADGSPFSFILPIAQQSATAAPSITETRPAVDMPVPSVPDTE